MAENNSFEETFVELSAFQELPNTKERIHEATDTGLAESSKEVVAKHLLSLFNQVTADMKPNEEKGLQVNDSTHISGENHAGNNGTANGPMHTDWDNIKLEPFQQDADDVYFVDKSEDDGYFHDMGSKKKNMKMQMQSTQSPLQRTTGNSFLKIENDMFYNRDSGVDLKAIASNFRRGHNLSAPNNTQESQVEDKSMLIMPRKLSFSPPGAFKKQKVNNLEPAKKCTPRRTPSSKNVITAAQQNKNVSRTYIKTKFKPSVNMKLTPAEVHLSLYIFQVQGDPRKITYDQRHFPSPETTWCLPPSFVWDIYGGSDVDKLLDMYTEEWMPPSRNLKYIYVPFEEMNGQWFLMVLCLHEELLYHFDSCGLPQTMSDKHQSIKKVCKVISEMVHCTPYPASYYSPYYEMELWDISQPQQLPTSTNGDNSAIWVLDWMTMGDAFTANISPNLNENLVRMRIALDLVQGAHNQTLNEVLGKAKAFWQHIKNSNQQ
ncbi:Ulp1 protease family, C-terminal catalytic domain [Sesbania bispinosa]|nr:Ulp1 protease family, C-terminal catalytic domain [Sesbania bispinosa]